MTDLDVIVAGAGPAGVATAVALLQSQPARAGRVLCLERRRMPREKPCGGALTGAALSALGRLGLQLRVPATMCSTGVIAHRDVAARVELPATVAVVKRSQLDADLVAQARQRGVEVQEGESVEGFTVDRCRGCVEVRTASGRRLTARVLVGADGAGSAVRRALLPGGPPPLRLLHAEVPAPASMAEHRELTYDFSVLDDGVRGYAWVFPAPDGRLDVGLMHTPTRYLPTATAHRVLRRVLERRGLEPGIPIKTWPAWRFHPGVVPVAPHVMCVGDALGIDALTAEGLGPSLQQAMVAAGCIAAGLREGDLGFRSYGAALASSCVGRELRVAGLMARLLYAPNGPALWLPLALGDARTQALIAARVSGATELHDRKLTLAAVLARYLLTSAARRLRGVT